MNDKNILPDDELENVTGGTGVGSGSAVRSAVTGMAAGILSVKNYAAGIAAAAGSIVSGSGPKCPCGGTFVLDDSAGKYVCDRCGDVLSARAER